MSDFEQNMLIQKDKTQKRRNILTTIVVIVVPLIILGTFLGFFLGFKRDVIKYDIQKIVSNSVSSTLSFFRLSFMCNRFGPRLSGSTNLENAIDYMVEELNNDQFDLVKTEEVYVPHWVRGNESLFMLEPYYKQLPVMSLGGSISTSGTLVGEVLVVRSFDELKTKNATGKIVVYNQPYTGYSSSVSYRSQGAVNAQQAGAIASLTRSITPLSLSTPHTGGQSSRTLPAGAITVEVAQQFQFLQDQGIKIVIALNFEAQNLNDSLSRNVIAQINGTGDKIIVIGGHIDSWDVGVGAQDDAAGVFVCWEALRLLRLLGVSFKSTIRLVGWTNEENGAKGAEQYSIDHESEAKDTLLAFESDVGIFNPFVLQYPMGENFPGNNEGGWKFVLDLFRKYLVSMPLSIDSVQKAGGGVDINFLIQQGVPGMSLSHLQNDKYFEVHHTDADTVDKVNQQDFQKASAIIASLIYLIDYHQIDFRK